MYSLYLITNQINGKRYVGQTCRTVACRFIQHVSEANRNSPYAIHSAIRKHGREAFAVSLIEKCSTKERADDLERRWIRVCDSMLGNGYNMAGGGGGQVVGFRHSAETKARMSESHTGLKRSPEAVAKTAAARRGHTHTAETKARISAALTGRSPTESARAKQSLAMRGRKQSTEHVALRVASRAGYSASEETKRKISETKRRRNSARVSR